MNLTIKGWVMDTIRGFFGFLDKAVYSLISIMFQGIFNIANASNNLIDADLFEKFANRIYIIIGIFMVFKLVFSLLNAVVNPDSLNDKEKGMGKIIPRMMLSLILLILVPTIFNLAFELQEKALPALPELIIGKNYTDRNNNIDVNASQTGELLAFDILSAFIHVSDECGGAQKSPTLGNSQEEITGSLLEFEDAPDGDINKLFEHLNDSCSSGNKNVYKYDYLILISTAVGVLVVIILLGFTIDIAIRVFKLIVLRMLAPIPIISYIDPKSSKDGMFSSWIQQLISTYMDLFLRLGIIYFGIYMLENVVKGSVIQGLDLPAMQLIYVYVFLIIGLFMFMKFAPTFIKKLLGIKPGAGTALGTAMTLGGLGGAARGIKERGLLHPIDNFRSARVGSNAAIKNETSNYNNGKTPDNLSFSTGYSNGMNMKPSAPGTGLKNQLYNRPRDYMNYKSAEGAYQNSASNLRQAESTYNSANSNYESALSSYNSANSALEAHKANREQISSKLNNAQSEYNTAKDNYQRISASGEKMDFTESAKARETLQQAESNLSNAKRNAEVYVEQYNSMASDVDDKRRKLDSTKNDLRIAEQSKEAHKDRAESATTKYQAAKTQKDSYKK